MTKITEKFRFVCATRGSYDDFFQQSPLGRSLSIYRAPFAEVVLFDTNTDGLPKVYNEAIRDAGDDPAILIFIHDDVHLCDFFWHIHVLAALQKFEIVGLAGNRRRVPNQPTWCHIDEQFTPDSADNLSGIVAHGKGFPPANLSSFGPPVQRVKLLDGVFLAARSETLRRRQISFDERFDFHFYDMDFCRQAEAKQVSVGTLTLSAIHESGGNFDTPAWREGYQRYLEKWES